MKKVTGRMLLRIAYDAVLSGTSNCLGFDLDDFDLSVQKFREPNGEHWYVLNMQYAREGDELRQSAIYFGQADLHEDNASKAIKQFRWIVSHKARSYVKGRRFERQGFYDGIWYTCVSVLNDNPLVARWYVQDLPGTYDRSLTVVWKKDGIVLGEDYYRLSNKDYENDPVESHDSLKASLCKASERVANESISAVPKSKSPVHRRW